jgi:hypothetical protein
MTNTNAAKGPTKPIDVLCETCAEQPLLVQKREKRVRNSRAKLGRVKVLCEGID